MNTIISVPKFNPVSIEVLYEQLEDENSPVSQYIQSSTLNFILRSLTTKERQTFMLFFTQEGSSEQAFIYAEAKINNFDSELQKHIFLAMESLLE